MGYILRMLIDPSNGAVNWLLLKIGLLSNPLVLLKEGWSASLTLILVTGWKFTGFNAALFLAGLVVIPVDTLEAATIDGCNYTQKLFKVMLPQMWPTMIAVSVFCLTGTWQLFALPVALAGTSHGSIQSLDTIAVVFYRWAFGREGFGMASAMMLLVALFLFLGSLGMQYIVKKKAIEY
jgi:ABC-type sugar transport system permease subunit